MGVHERMKNPNESPEAAVVHAENMKRNIENSSDLVAEYRLWAEKAAQEDDVLSNLLKSAGHVNAIMSKESYDDKITTAQKIIFENPHLLRKYDHVDTEDKRFFLVALVEELAEEVG